MTTEGQQLNEEVLKTAKDMQAFHERIGEYAEREEKGSIQAEEIKNVIREFYDKINLAEQVLKIQPLYYDNSKIWWFWDINSTCWKIIDETAILNIVRSISTANTINSKDKTEIIEAFKQAAREKKPKEMKKTWIQFKGEIFDINTGDKFKATPEYFAVNPIPWELDKECFEVTPTIDKIFTEWVGEENKKQLYEIMAYCMIPDYPIHTLFYLIGAGRNGKTCFLNLLRKFIGQGNITTSELHKIIKSQFEATKLHNKLACLMGECNLNELNETEILKKLTGQDLIPGEYKFREGFDFMNYAKIIIATNSVPETTDKTIGFYSRHLLIDFPNQFSGEVDILSTIPEEEFKSLALKCCSILHDLLKIRAFTNQGTYEERQKRYEDRSNPLGKFIKENCNTKNSAGFVYCWEFEERFNEWCKDNKFRNFSGHSIGKKLNALNFEPGKRYPELRTDNKHTQWRCWYGLEWKNKTDETDKTL